MNFVQELWWKQARAEYELLRHLRQKSVAACHQLHYLQMVTEKLGKAYFWRSLRPPGKSHASFVKFLQALANRSSADQHRIPRLLGFQRADAFENWIRSSAPLAYSLERLAPALAGDDGPNAEYPWPRKSPVTTPIEHAFPLWDQLTYSGPGRRFLKVIDHAVEQFPNYA